MNMPQPRLIVMVSENSDGSWYVQGPVMENSEDPDEWHEAAICYADKESAMQDAEYRAGFLSSVQVLVKYCKGSDN